MTEQQNTPTTTTTADKDTFNLVDWLAEVDVNDVTARLTSPSAGTPPTPSTRHANGPPTSWHRIASR